ncbi:hypothetical protein AVDCRST_MAG94-1022 [uncultured Leptolyngbya sp.]|uniref:Uncharacterized protein n=1 Tax=uncultured Leptolyngbya sp. TaxID=332963 RepID=A0A6J4KRL6_9CYAN|nr:hypothetical protein AVDCRST_MAG94-1022 [uncultured Leptolyngbya sp.]
MLSRDKRSDQSVDWVKRRGAIEAKQQNWSATLGEGHLVR